MNLPRFFKFFPCKVYIVYSMRAYSKDNLEYSKMIFKEFLKILKMRIKNEYEKYQLFYYL